MKKKYAIPALIFLIIAVFIGFNQFGSVLSPSDATLYNMNPDVSQKVIGSKVIREMGTMLPIQSTDDLVRFADLVIVGTVISDGKNMTAEWPKVEGLESETDPLNNRPPVNVTYTDIKVEKVLYGEIKADTITLLQLGQAGDDRGETKVKKDKKMLFVLTKTNEGENIFNSVCYEDGLFEINNNKALSLSDNIALAKYDGIQIDLLEKDIVKSIKAKKN